MDNIEGQMTELINSFPNKEIKKNEEAGITYFMIPAINLPDTCSPRVVDVLLCPTQRDGYPSRLFFSEKVVSKTNRNWNTDAVILARQWHAFSWKLTVNDTLLKMVLGHLQALG